MTGSKHTGRGAYTVTSTRTLQLIQQVVVYVQSPGERKLFSLYFQNTLNFPSIAHIDHTYLTILHIFH